MSWRCCLRRRESYCHYDSTQTSVATVRRNNEAKNKDSRKGRDAALAGVITMDLHWSLPLRRKEQSTVHSPLSRFVRKTTATEVYRYTALFVVYSLVCVNLFYTLFLFCFLFAHWRCDFVVVFCTCLLARWRCDVVVVFSLLLLLLLPLNDLARSRPSFSITTVVLLLLTLRRRSIRCPANLHQPPCNNVSFIPRAIDGSVHQKGVHQVVRHSLEKRPRAAVLQKGVSVAVVSGIPALILM